MAKDTDKNAKSAEKATGTASESTGAAKAAAAASDSGESGKRKGRRPGVPGQKGRKLREVLKKQRAELIKSGSMNVRKAIQTLKSLKRVKFDETIELHMHLGIDTTQSDQMVRGAVTLPHGIGKTVRVLVFCQGDNVAKAKEAGADIVGSDDLIKKIQNESWLDFDVALATQDMMGQVSRLGKVLGPRGLMPSPKAGTVIPMTGDIAKAVVEFKAGKVEYRADKGGSVHAGVGKMSFSEDKLFENIMAFIEQVRLAKPSGVKGNYVLGTTLSATMSAGIPLSV